MAVALRLGIDCGVNVDPSGVHSLVCRHAPGRVARHHALNECIFRALGLQESLPVKNHLVWFALMVNGQMVALLFIGSAARPLRGMSQ